MSIKWKVKAAQVGEELEQTGRVVVRSPALAQGAECVMRVLLGCVLSSAQLFGGHAPFGVALVACSGSGLGGLCALAGSCLGYLLFRGFTEGVRWAAAGVLTFSVSFAFYDLKLCRRAWFMPLVGALMDAATGFVYLSDVDWRPDQVIFFATEVLLVGACGYLYTLAFAGWDRGWAQPGRRESGRGAKTGEKSLPKMTEEGQKVGLFALALTCLMALSEAELMEGVSLGRALAVLLVLCCARSAGPGIGAAVGVCAGVCMDLTVGGAPFYAMAYGFSGLLSGGSHRQGRVFTALSYIVANAAAVLWCWSATPRISGLYEVFAASVAFILVPEGWLRRLGLFLRREGEPTLEGRLAQLAGERLAAVAAAFRHVGESLRSAFPPGENLEDPSSVFDRTAQRVCRKCALRNTCWEKEYVSTFNALNDALPVLLEKGKGEAADYPAWFASRCLQFSDFLRTANEEVSALRYRRQYQSKIGESRRAVCRQYETLSDVLTQTSAELSAPLVPDPVRSKRLRQHLTALGAEGEGRAYYDGAGHLRLEVTGEGARALDKPGQVQKLSQLMDAPLRLRREEGEALTFLQAEPLMAQAGQCARRREGQQESGDTGTWFKREDGSLFVLLCDGMGSGRAAHAESALAVRLLEDFLRSGVDTLAALQTVNAALALRNEESGAFTTVDLLRIDLFTGAGEVCKLGAAPTYVKLGDRVERLTGAALPAGLAQGEDVTPDRRALQLQAGDCVVLLSDGVVGTGEDDWLRELLSGFHGVDPKALAAQIMEESEERVGPGDDRMAVVIALKNRS